MILSFIHICPLHLSVCPSLLIFDHVSLVFYFLLLNNYYESLFKFVYSDFCDLQSSIISYNILHLYTHAYVCINCSCMCPCVSMYEYLYVCMYICEWVFLSSRSIDPNIHNVPYGPIPENNFVIFYSV